MARLANYYRILQVDPEADQEIIEAAYKRLAQKYYPDVNKSPSAAERMKKINVAYETLRDPIKRAAYDQQLAESRRSAAQKPNAQVAQVETTSLEIPKKLATRRIPTLLAVALLLVVAIAAVVFLSQRQPPTQSLPSAPGDVATHLAQGRQLLEQGKLNEAIAEFQSAIRLDANSVEGHFQLGNAYFQQGKLEEAAKEFQKAVELAPENVDARSNLGAAYYELGQFDKAAAEFKKAIALQPEDADIHYNLGAAYVQQFQFEAGIAEFNEALRLNPNLTRAYFGLGNAYKLQGKKQEAIQALEKFLSLSDEADLRAIAESLLAELKRQ